MIQSLSGQESTNNFSEETLDGIYKGMIMAKHYKEQNKVLNSLVIKYKELDLSNRNLIEIYKNKESNYIRVIDEKDFQLKFKDKYWKLKIKKEKNNKWYYIAGGIVVGGITTAVLIK